MLLMVLMRRIPVRIEDDHLVRRDVQTHAAHFGRNEENELVRARVEVADFLLSVGIGETPIEETHGVCRCAREQVVQSSEVNTVGALENLVRVHIPEAEELLQNPPLATVFGIGKQLQREDANGDAGKKKSLGPQGDRTGNVDAAQAEKPPDELYIRLQGHQSGRSRRLISVTYWSTRSRMHMSSSSPLE